MPTVEKIGRKEYYWSGSDDDVASSVNMDDMEFDDGMRIVVRGFFSDFLFSSVL
jgi:hypothetical protein